MQVFRIHFLLVCLTIPLCFYSIAGAHDLEEIYRQGTGRVDDVPGLPRVLLIGDHGWTQQGDRTLIGYAVTVRSALAGRANIHRVLEPGAHTAKGVRMLDEWLGDEPWDIIHFNFGLHDLKEDRNGAPAVSLRQFEANLAQIVSRLNSTGAMLIWASTTPVTEAVSRRSPIAVTQYNEVAERLMAGAGIPVNDLNAYALPHLHTWQFPRNAHFTPEGSHALGLRVAAVISLYLEAEVASAESSEITQIR
jgi:acyl-CoA thioesterase-1